VPGVSTNFWDFFAHISKMFRARILKSPAGKPPHETRFDDINIFFA
jgi:hypothetical protein